MAIVDTDWEALFCCVDDFCQAFIPAMHARLLADGNRQRNRQPALSESELISILIAFQTSRLAKVSSDTAYSNPKKAATERSLSPAQAAAVCMSLIPPHLQRPAKLAEESAECRHGVLTGSVVQVIVPRGVIVPVQTDMPIGCHKHAALAMGSSLNRVVYRGEQLSDRRCHVRQGSRVNGGALASRSVPLP